MEAVNQNSHVRTMNIGTFTCYPINQETNIKVEHFEQVKYGGKAIFPESVLRTISYRLQTPIIFKLANKKTGKTSFCGVHTFDGEDNNVSLPDWLMKQLDVYFGDKIQVSYVISPVATGKFAKFQSMTKFFLTIPNPKSVLEEKLKNYACLTSNDVIHIYFNTYIHELKVCETQPSDVISIVECDLQVDFVMVPDKPETLSHDSDLDQIRAENNHDPNVFSAFMGIGKRLDCKTDENQEKRKNSDQSYVNKYSKRRLGMPDYGYKIGILNFLRHRSDIQPNKTESNADKNESNNKTDNKADSGSNKNESNGNKIESEDNKTKLENNKTELRKTNPKDKK